jgi:hypothetical protein
MLETRNIEGIIFKTKEFVRNFFVNNIIHETDKYPKMERTCAISAPTSHTQDSHGIYTLRTKRPGKIHKWMEGPIASLLFNGK